MRALEISLVATIASLLGWWLRFPQSIWPAHPYFADFLMALVFCLVLQYVWPQPNRTTERK